MKRFLSVLFLLFFALSLFPNWVINAEPAPIDPDTVRAEIDGLISASAESLGYSILKICGPEHDLCVVAIDPPYREFPNVFIFGFDAASGKYLRVFEGLCLGIQDEPSGKPDLHNVGLGIDTKLPDDSVDFDSDIVKEMVGLSTTNGMIAIPYRNFIHFHGPQNTGRLYTIDKTNFYDLAVKLVGPVFKDYPRHECTMYDTPDLTDLRLTYKDGTFCITAVTDNRQQWRATFTGVDPENRFLLGKKLEAEQLAGLPVDEYEALIQKARAESERNPKNALELLNQAKRINPQKAKAYLYSGKIYYQMGETNQAGSEFQLAVELSSGRKKAEQINIIDTATSEFKSEKESKLYTEAYQAIESGKPRNAERLLTKALKLNPYNVRLYYEMGYVWIELNDFPKALVYFEKGRSINPANRYLLNELKYVYMETGELQRLKEIVNEIIKYYGEDPFLYQQLGFTYFQNNLIDLAIETFETNLQKFPRYYISYYSLGQIHFVNRNYSKALELLSVFVKNITPEDFKDYQGSLEDYKEKAQEMIAECELKTEGK